MASLRLVVGLGNPGAEHLRTRHNAGFWFLDALALRMDASLAHDRKVHGEIGKARIDGENVWLMKPSTYMNKSGIAIVSALAYFKIEPEEMLVAHDDLDLSPGTARLKFDGGHGGQNGLRDTFAHLGHGKFHRLRIGIGHPGHKDQVSNWVLGRPGKVDEAAMIESVAAALDVFPMVAAGQFDRAMKQLHTKES